MLSMNHDADLPAGWVRVALGDVCLGIEKTSPLLHDPNEEFKYVDIESVDNQRMEIASPKTYTWREAPSRAQQILKTNDTLFSTVRPYLKNIAFVNSELNNQIASTGFCVIRPCLVNPKFIFYLVSQNSFVDKVSQFQTGTSYPAVKNSDILERDILLPPLAEQNRIVTRLKTLLAELDQTETSLQQAIAQAKEYRQAVLRDAFSGKLTAEVVKEGKLPEGWEMKTLGEECIIVMGQSPPSSTYNTEGRGIPLINGPIEFGPHALSATVKSKFTTSPTKFCKKNDLILCVRGSTAGRTNIAGFDACIGRGVAALRAKQNQNYLNYFIIGIRDYLLSIGTGSTFPNISSQQLDKLSFPVPSIEEQNNVVRQIESNFDRISGFEEVSITKIDKIKTLRQILFQDAFAGKLVPQYPADTTATQLLEHIKSEKTRMAIEQKQREKATREAKKAKAKEPEMLKTIVQVLKERGGIYPAVAVWRECEYKGDIEKFYAELKILMGTDNKVTEDHEKQNLILVK